MNIINLLGIFGGISEFFYVALGLAFVIGLVWVFLKFKDSREIIIKILVILLMIALFISALVCGYKTYNYFTANSTNWGDFIGTVLNKTEVNYLGDYTFKIDNVQFDYTGTEDTYKITYQTKELVDIDLDSANWVIYVNDMPTYNVEKGADYINGDYSYTFYNEDRQEILTDKLAIKFAFYANYAKFTVTTTGGETAVNLWQDYINKNNFTISLKTASYQQGDEIIANGIRNYVNFSLNVTDDKTIAIYGGVVTLNLIREDGLSYTLELSEDLYKTSSFLIDYGIYEYSIIANHECLIFENPTGTLDINKNALDFSFKCKFGDTSDVNGIVINYSVVEGGALFIKLEDFGLYRSSVRVQGNGVIVFINLPAMLYHLTFGTNRYFKCNSIYAEDLNGQAFEVTTYSYIPLGADHVNIVGSITRGLSYFKLDVEVYAK